MKASLRLDHELLAVEGEHTVHAMLELVAPAVEKDAERPPLRLALVIDRSASMSGPKLEHTKAAAAQLIQRLAPRDEVALVAYDDEVRLLAPMAPVDRDLLQREIAAITPGGSTNLSGGWLKGAEEVARSAGDGPRKVLLLTDGQANQGVIDVPSLVEIAGNLRRAGVGTTTIGYGADFNENLLTQMAEAGGGNAHFAASPEDAPGIFAREFTDLARVVAQNLSVEIRPTEDVKLVGVLNEYPSTAVVGGVQLTLGDVYSEENRRVVFELHIPEMAKLGVCNVADVVIRYVTLGDEVAAHEITLPLVINMVSAAEAEGATADAEVVEEVLILKAARAQREARERADHGDFDGAQKLLRESAGRLRDLASGSARAEELLQEAELLERHAETTAPAMWDASSAKAMHYNAHRMRQARRRFKHDYGN
ncbi:MAG TPA: VWA domain-containing protein [Actinomycetota bacterium]|jgi:Ca-activated chloride channel homolog|nr:VWA domain-containing protein [Actinomycetota bacterium]